MKPSPHQDAAVEVARLRSTLGGIAQEECCGDNLAILLASYFEPGVESDELDDSGTWKQGAIDACDKVLDAIHAHYANLIEQQAKALSEADSRYSTAVGSRLEWRHAAETWQAKCEDAEARLAEAMRVIGFYADQRRYDGPNLRPIPDDPFAKPDAVYIHDVTRDHGEIARSFLNSASNKEPR